MVPPIQTDTLPKPKHSKESPVQSLLNVLSVEFYYFTSLSLSHQKLNGSSTNKDFSSRMSSRHHICASCSSFHFKTQCNMQGVVFFRKPITCSQLCMWQVGNLAEVHRFYFQSPSHFSTTLPT